MSLVLPDIADLASLGGIKVNAVPVIDPTTDEDAGDRNSAFANIAAMTHTAIKAWASFYPTATPAIVTPNGHDSVWGSTAPVQPSVSRSSTGLFVVTWPTTITDELSVSRTVNFRRAFAAIDGTAASILSATQTSANSVTVRVFDAAGTLVDLTTSYIVTVFTV